MIRINNEVFQQTSACNTFKRGKLTALAQAEEPWSVDLRMSLIDFNQNYTCKLRMFSWLHGRALDRPAHNIAAQMPNARYAKCELSFT